MTFQLSKLSHRHDAIMNFMLLYPKKTLKECAEYFGLTQAYLSVVIHSDIFQARLRERQDAVFNGTVLHLRDKLEALAHLTVDKLMEKVSDSNDPEFIRDTAAQTLAQIGYGPKGNPAQPAQSNVQINIGVDSNTLAEARKLMDTMRLKASDDTIPAVQIVDETDS